VEHAADWDDDGSAPAAKLGQQIGRKSQRWWPWAGILLVALLEKRRGVAMTRSQERWRRRAVTPLYIYIYIYKHSAREDGRARCRRGGGESRVEKLGRQKGGKASRRSVFL
jgi:hypothetical protein